MEYMGGVSSAEFQQLKKSRKQNPDLKKKYDRINTQIQENIQTRDHGIFTLKCEPSGGFDKLKAFDEKPTREQLAGLRW